MLADAAIFHKPPLQIALFGVAQLTFILTLAYFAKRAHPDRLRFARIAWLTAACLATSLPFAFVAYLLWPWEDLGSKNLRLAAVMALSGTFFAPIVTPFVLLRWVSRNGYRAHETKTNG